MKTVLGAHQAAAQAPSTRRLTSGVLFTDAAGRVLLLQPSFQPSWVLPGGEVRAGEAPRAAARRVVGETLGVQPAIGSLLVVDWLPPTPRRGDVVVLVYDGGTLDPADAAGIRLASEMNAYGFVDMDGAVGLVPERLERRIRAALSARRLGRAIELEDGRPQIARELSDR